MAVLCTLPQYSLLTLVITASWAQFTRIHYRNPFRIEHAFHRGRPNVPSSYLYGFERSFDKTLDKELVGSARASGYYAPAPSPSPTIVTVTETVHSLITKTDIAVSTVLETDTVTETVTDTAVSETTKLIETTETEEITVTQTETNTLTVTTTSLETITATETTIILRTKTQTETVTQLKISSTYADCDQPTKAYYYHSSIYDDPYEHRPSSQPDKPYRRRIKPYHTFRSDTDPSDGEPHEDYMPTPALPSAEKAGSEHLDTEVRDGDEKFPAPDDTVLNIEITSEVEPHLNDSLPDVFDMKIHSNQDVFPSESPDKEVSVSLEAPHKMHPPPEVFRRPFRNMNDGSVYDFGDTHGEINELPDQTHDEQPFGSFKGFEGFGNYIFKGFDPFAGFAK